MEGSRSFTDLSPLTGGRQEVNCPKGKRDHPGVHRRARPPVYRDIMSFETLLGNEQLKKELSASLRKGNISHCYLLSGPEGSGKRTLAKLLAAAVLCRGEQRPCGVCQPCRKVAEGNHPDFITVEDPEHKNVAVRVIREARADVFVVPNESERKVYLFPQDMGVEGQNALLKVLEEPPSYAVFLILTDNAEKLLPTVRSRCRELKLKALPRDVLLGQLKREFPEAAPEDIASAAERSGGWLGQAKKALEEGVSADPQTEGFVDAFCRRDGLGLAQILVPMEKWKRDALIPMLEQWRMILEQALSLRSGGTAVSRFARRAAAERTSKDLYDAIRVLGKAISYAQSNVSPGTVCGWLVWELR